MKNILIFFLMFFCTSAVYLGLVFGIYSFLTEQSNDLNEWSSYVQGYEYLFEKHIDCKEFLLELGEGDEEYFTGGLGRVFKSCVEQLANN